MLKVLLTNLPQILDDTTRGSLSPCWPLGIIYVGTALREAGHKVQLIDMYAPGCVPFVDMDKKTNLYFEGARYTDGKLIGSDTIIHYAIVASNPDIIGISVQFTFQKSLLHLLVEQIRTYNSKVIIIVGGPYATLDYENILKENPTVDCVVLGDGEETMVKLANGMQAGRVMGDIPGIAYRGRNGDIINTGIGLVKELDMLPFPDYTMLPVFHYYASQGCAKVQMFTSRGCPNSCNFCSVGYLTNRRWRAHSAERVLAEMEILDKVYGITDIDFEDDNMFLRKDRVVAIFEGMLKRDLHFKMVHRSLHVNTVDKEIIDLMKRVGFFRVVLAVESGNERVLNKVIRKNISIDRVLQEAQWVIDSGLELSCNWVLGFPDETMDEINDTIALARKIKAMGGVQKAWVGVATPEKHTRMYEQAVQLGLIEDGMVYPRGIPAYENEHWGKEELRKIRNDLMQELNS